MRASTRIRSRVLFVDSDGWAMISGDVSPGDRFKVGEEDVPMYGGGTETLDVVATVVEVGAHWSTKGASGHWARVTPEKPFPEAEDDDHDRSTSDRA